MAPGKNKSQQKNLSDEIIVEKKAKVKAKSGSKNMDQTSYLSMISHEVRTPLATIFSSVELIQRINKSDEPDKDLVRERIKVHALKIKNSVFRAVELLDNIMAINNMESRQITNACDVIQIKIFVTGIIDKAKSNYDYAPDINCDFNLYAESCRIDKKVLDLIYSNLVSNAIKFSDKAGLINVSVKLTDSALTFEIADRGIGIPEGNIPHLYEPFFRGDNTGDIAGNGLGMYIVKKAVDLYKGQISCKSKLNSGTKFIVKVPAEAV